ncbi:unnamed protein product [Acanthoscelides obtectus]|uniref:Uncharacterized protein n=1 Tax=Acanthoscelides obtectus TaxID=200917 RepID=A0A9P0Q529_ACAOB|nr:unnamed protein product [Acanthoscelides obtectus]CAK1643657.1 hypothetical protein AOBTE_LOCUS13623 [Acanthoscelides obtectus]
METTDLKNFLSLIEGSSSPFLHRKKFESGNDFNISELVHVQVHADHPGKMFCKDTFNGDSEVLDLNRISRRSVIFPEEIPLIRVGPKPISDKKYEDLQKLMQWVPKMYDNFYQNLPQTGNNVIDG